MANFKAVGSIVGSPLRGLCERMCLHVECVTDACRARRDGQTASLVLDDVQGTAPFVFSDATQAGDVTLEVDSVCGGTGGCRRVQARIRIGVRVRYTDANGACCCSVGTLELTRELNLRVPEQNGAQYRFDADAVLVCTNGVFISDNAVSLSFCIVETYRALTFADVLVPTYGFAAYPDCNECDGCSSLMQGRIFPETR